MPEAHQLVTLAGVRLTAATKSDSGVDPTRAHSIKQ
jgi:hypothetical protein